MKLKQTTSNLKNVISYITARSLALVSVSFQLDAKDFAKEYISPFFNNFFSYSYKKPQKQAKCGQRPGGADAIPTGHEKCIAVKNNIIGFFFFFFCPPRWPPATYSSQPRWDPSPVRCTRVRMSSRDTRFASDARPKKHMMSMKQVVRLTLMPNSLVA